MLARPRKRHEESQYHKNAQKDGGTTMLLSCSGVDLGSADATRSKLGFGEGPTYVKIWLQAGCPAVLNSAVDTDSIHVHTDAQGRTIVRDKQCALKAPPGSMCVRGKTACRLCLEMLNKNKVFNLIREWAQRILYVDLVHFALRSQSTEQHCHALYMKKLFPELSRHDLETVDYSTLIVNIRNTFMHIPLAKQNDSLSSFIGRSLQYLTPKMLVGLPPGIHTQVTSYIDSLAAGEILPHESKAIVSRQGVTS